uniref:Uncharacterized protein n=1 Tax=Mesocestoides corti TaxID=53468 RepID=A0A5K3G085_MESCO
MLEDKSRHSRDGEWDGVFGAFRRTPTEVEERQVAFGLRLHDDTDIAEHIAAHRENVRLLGATPQTPRSQLPTHRYRAVAPAGVDRCRLENEDEFRTIAAGLLIEGRSLPIDSSEEPSRSIFCKEVYTLRSECTTEYCECKDTKTDNRRLLMQVTTHPHRPRNCQNSKVTAVSDCELEFTQIHRAWKYSLDMRSTSKSNYVLLSQS